MDNNLVSLTKKAFVLLSKQEKQKLFFLTIAMFFAALLEVVGIASILPFLDLVLHPEKIQESHILSYMYNLSSFSEKNFIVFMGSCSVVLLVGSGIIQILINKRLQLYTWGLNHSLSYRLISKYLQNRYEFFINRNSSELTKNIITEVQQVTYGIYLSLVMIMARSIVVFIMLSFIFMINPIVFLYVTTILVGGYLLIYKFIKNFIVLQGKRRTEAHELRFKAISEVIGGIKEVKLMQKEEIFLKNFETPSKIFSDATAKNNIYPMIPRYFMEILALGGLVLCIVIFYAMGNDISNIIPTATVFALAGYKLMPSLQIIFKSLSEMKYNAKPMNILYNDLKDFDFVNQEVDKEQIKNKMIFSERLELKNINFTYQETTKPILKDISISLKYGKSLALKGTTGSGKTTLIDILLGLLKPTSGYIEVDGIKIDGSNIKQWQQNIAYVPQFIFLLDDTIAANIAFGDENIDMKKVKWASTQAMLGDVLADLDDGLDTMVGEDGVKLSGGQRQRIGIARALYRKPRLLVLDEATSALDETTEKSVMDNIYNFSTTCSVIMIAHRLSTIEKADEIIDLSKLKG